MLFPIYIYASARNGAISAELPNFPNCLVSVHDFKDLAKATQNAIELYCQNDNLPIVSMMPITTLERDTNYQGGAWLFIEIEFDALN